jgi:nucleoside-diphosphate-sugar epimerase
LIDDFAKLQGDIAILGVGGKVGPTLAMMAKRAAPQKRIIGVARFSDKAVRERLEAAGVECISCELLDRNAVAKLPEVPNIVFMAGKKFGTSGGEAFTWAMNAVVPSIVAERFPKSKFVGFSTLCVYPFASVSGAGSREDGAITPLGEYANSCVARERVFQYYSQKHSTPGRMVRLNYAIDVRYGVLHDIGQWVWKGQAIDIRTPVANCIWQGDAISHILRCLLHGTTPSTAINIGAPQTANVRAVAERFGVLFGKKPIFVGQEESTAWHNDCSQAQKLFGDPVIDLDTMIRWNADWIMRGGESHNKPTHYEERAGQF